MAVPQQAPRRDRPGGVSPENAWADNPKAPAPGPSQNVRPLREPPPAWREPPPVWKVVRRPGSFAGDVAVKELRERMALAPDLPPAPPLREERGAVFGMVRRLTGLVTLAAVCASGFVWISTPRGQAVDRSPAPAGVQQVAGLTRRGIHHGPCGRRCRSLHPSGLQAAAGSGQRCATAG